MKPKIHPIATITNAAGYYGEVRLKPLSRYFDEFVENGSLVMGICPESTKSINLEIVKGIGKKRRFKFVGIDNSEKAKEIVGKTVFVLSEDDRIMLISKDLIGFEVLTINEDYVGFLTDVIWLPASDVYVIQDESKEILIPVIPEVINGVDFENKVIIITPMDGLID